MPNPEVIINQYLNRIIDDNHPLFTPITDEYQIETTDVRGTFQKTYKHKNGKTFQMTWDVYYGTPETVKTVFRPALCLS